MEKIPFINAPSFNETVTLDGTLYTLRFDWNSRYEFWSMSFQDQLRNPLCNGIKLVKNYELITQYVGKGLPPGELYALDTGQESSIRERIKYDDFVNDVVRLIYITEDEL